jgi:hypothetical protein
MAMKKIKKGVESLALEELELANEQKPLFHSCHEGAAVIYEELEECMEEFERLKDAFEELWACVRKDSNDDIRYVDLMEICAVDLACEAIQVAAMCKKYSMSTYYQKMLEEGTNR